MRNLTFLLFFIAFATFSVKAQPQNGFSFDEITSVPVLQGGDSLINAWAGGLNYPHFGTIDLDGDNVEDLLVFEKAGQRIIPFLNKGTSNGATKYKYAPKYRYSFPEGESFYLLVDYDCDGKKDVFTGRNGAMVVFRNVSPSNGLPQFQKAHSSTFLEGIYPSSGSSAPVSMASVDMPALVDVDNDGDLDILAFLFGENSVSWIENTQNCGLQYIYKERCWGHFLEDGQNSSIHFDACTPSGYKTNQGAHTGSTILALDLNADGVKEVLIADVSDPWARALFNNGTPDSAYMNAQDSTYPSYDEPINLQQFPAFFYEDIDGDGVKDLITTPNEPDFGTSFVSSDNIWAYHNQGADNAPDFDLSNKNFLRETQLDVGQGCVPRIVDLNGDGLNDIVLANAFYRRSLSSQKEAFIYLQNTGSIQNPEFTVVDTNFANIASYGLGPELIPAFGDLDQDNDIDMIVGDANGGLHYFINNGTLQNPSYSLQTPLITSLNRKNAAPFLIDVDEDGDLDLIVGKDNGTLSYFTNQSATNPSFNLETNFYGGVDVSLLTNGYSIPYLFRYNGFLNLMVSSESGVLQYDSIASVSNQPSMYEKQIGTGTLESADSDESPFGTSKASGRNRLLLLASELRNAGLVAGKITHLSFKVTNISNFVNKLSISMANVNVSDVTNFNTPLQALVNDLNYSFKPGWNEIKMGTNFEWDGYSNVMVEVCFRGNFTSSSIPDIKVEMSATSHYSNGYGDVTNFNTLQANGCQMPYLNSIKKRPNVKIRLTPSFPNTSIVMSDGHRNAAAFGDLDQDGFIDALLGNFAGGVTYYKGRQYVISTPEERTISSGLQVYPNPGQGQFSISSPNTGTATLRIFDLTGRQIREREITGAENQVDLSQEPDGMYIFLLQDGDRVESRKVILQH